MKYFLLFVLHIILIFSPAMGQVSEKASNDTTDTPIRTIYPYVYIDCRRCDYDFIRTELNFVNYVRDPEQADIHVFVTDESTAGGGREFQFSFIGRGNFTGTEYTMRHYVNPTTTFDEQREAIKRFLTMGYASFMLQTPLGM